MITARVITPWFVSEEGSFSPLIDHLLFNFRGWSWKDVTAQPVEALIPEPNLYVIELTCQADTLKAIQEDPRFQVIWSGSASGKPAASEFNLFKARLVELGVASEDLSAAAGATTAGRTWSQIEKKLIAWLSNRPRSEV